VLEPLRVEGLVYRDRALEDVESCRVERKAEPLEIEYNNLLLDGCTGDFTCIL
jgi:hypothetical protein